jgi:hypothetical protein
MLHLGGKRFRTRRKQEKYGSGTEQERVGTRERTRQQKKSRYRRPGSVERTPALPSAENDFIDAQGFAEYGKWHLGIDDEADEDTKRRFEFPYGDVEKVHRCAVLSAESRAGQYKHFDIERAAAHLQA